MQDNDLFDPEKITLIDIKMVKCHVETPEYFDISKIAGYQLDHSLQIGFNMDEKLARADFLISLKTDCRGDNITEASGNFNLIFIYRIENLEGLAVTEKNKRLNLNPGLANALSSITYSTSRGILMTRLQGTALQNFILPVINPNKLLQNKQDR
jgi:hypothetical protein